jgi:HK97 family phage major capsid protein
VILQLHKDTTMTTLELRQKKAKMIADARTFADKGLTTETRAQYDAMIADVVLINQDIEREDSLASFESEVRASAGRPKLDQPGDGTAVPTAQERSAQVKAAWEAGIRGGFRSLSAEQRSTLEKDAKARNLPLHNDEKRDLVTTVGNEGGYTVPTGFNSDIQVAVKSFGKILTKVFMFNTNDGAPIQLPLINDTAVVATEISQATVIGEQDVVFQQATSTPILMTSGIVRVSNSLLADSGVDVSGLLTRLFGIRYGRGLNTMLTTAGSANGTSVQALVANVAQEATIGTVGTLKFADINNTFISLDPGYVDDPSVAWSFNNATYGALLGIVDTYGRPIMVQSLAAGAPDTIYGKPVVINQALPNLTATAGTLTATGSPIMFGAWNSYWVRNAGPGRMKRLVERYADFDETAFVLLQRVSGQYLNAGSNPIIALRG